MREDMSETIIFMFDGTKFESNRSFYETGVCQLPDGRFIAVDEWLTTHPPQPVNYREVQIPKAEIEKTQSKFDGLKDGDLADVHAMSEADFGMVESFGIDDGELDEMSPQECFVLGYELAVVSSSAERDYWEFDLTVHAANIDRIENTLKRHNRQWSWMWPSDDKSESWVYLKVMGDDSEANDGN